MPTAADLALASDELARRDPVMRSLRAAHGPCRLRARQATHFVALARAVVYQQLAGSAARAIWARVGALFDGMPTPEAVLATPAASLRAAGLSASKAASILDLAAKVEDGTVPLRSLGRFDDDAVVERLVTVRGIGPWTAQMFLLFQLRRPDVWPVGDYGVRKGYRLAYGLDDLPAPRELDRLGDPFRPFRSVASWYLWRAAETLTP